MTRRISGARTTTLRFRLTLLATALVALVLLTSALALIVVQHRLLTRGVDEALLQRADNVQATAQEPSGGVLPGEGDLEDSFLQLLEPNGAVVAFSANVAAFPAAAVPLAAGDPATFRTAPVTRLSSHDYRIYLRSVPTSAGPRTLVIGKNLDDVKESVRVLGTSLAVAIPIVLLILAAMAWWLTGRALGPVESLRAEVADITGSQLQRRVHVEPRDDEISRLARTMNAMLERVQQATDRQRQFVADASHELRSPLTRIRSSLEVGLAHPSAIPPQEAYAELLTDTQQLQQLVDDLLFLARSESGVLPRPDRTVDLDDLVFAEASRLRSRGRVAVDVQAVTAGRVTGDPQQLARALANLASNAERYAATTVAFELREENGRTVLAVTDDGPGIPAERRQAVFERFTRSDSSRSPEDGGAGLGLAIVHDIVDRHHGSILITERSPGGARVIVGFPGAT